MKKICTISAGVFLLLFLCFGIHLALAEELPVVDEFPVLDEGLQMPGMEEPPVVDEFPGLDEGPQMPGRVEGTGTHFEIKDSEYLNIILDSSEEIRLTLESIPEMVSMFIESTSSATSTVITIRGFSPLTTYYKYEDDYHNLEVLTTDGDGSCSYVQDISTRHYVFIQTRAGTKFIPSDTEIGTWDPVTRTYTLTTNVDETIQIDEDDLTLDGAGHTITGSGKGIYLSNRNGVTIKNLNVTNYHTGIYIYESNDNNLTGNTVSNKYYGIHLDHSNNNNLTGNTASNILEGSGISLRSSNNNNLTDNTASNNNGSGIYLSSSSYNNLTDNTTSNNSGGIYLRSSSYNILTGNTASNHEIWNGIRLQSSSYNILTGNTASNNAVGIYLWYYSNYNQIYNNNFIGNENQAFVNHQSNGNVFNLDKPIGGNYWSDWTSPDSNGDGFVDDPYVFTGGQDNLPWTVQDGWPPNYPPVPDAGPDQTVFVDEEVTFDGSGSSDPDGEIVSFEWYFGDGDTDSGSDVFHIYITEGTYTVTLTVTDNDDLTGTDTATVTVLTPAEAINNLTATIEDMNLQHGIENSLTSKLENVIAKLEKGNVNAAINQLEAFINQVEAQRGKKLTDEQADELVNAANSIISAISAIAPPALAKIVIPSEIQLRQNYPNPFNPTTTIRYELPEASNVILTIYDILGREVIRWEQQEEPGYKQLLWDSKDRSGKLVPTGIYIYRFTAISVESDNHFTASRKMVLMK